MSCAICGAAIDKENAPILAMGGFGNPRYVCNDCAEKLETVTESMDPEKINESIEALADRIAKKDTDDAVTINTLSDILRGGKERAELIEKGEYSVDETACDEVIDDLPEELAETEEDKALDARDAEKNAKIQKVLDIVTLGIIGAAVVALVLYFILIK